MAGKVFSEIAERVFAKHLAKNLSEAKDSASILIPDVKCGDIAAAHYVLNNINISTVGIPDNTNLNSPIWGVPAAQNNKIVLKRYKGNNRIVPNVKGMGAKDAVYLLESLGLKARVGGVGKVESQSLAAGKRVVRGEAIHLILK